jgi:hypothetical protein
MAHTEARGAWFKFVHHEALSCTNFKNVASGDMSAVGEEKIGQ